MNALAAQAAPAAAHAALIAPLAGALVAFVVSNFRVAWFFALAGAFVSVASAFLLATFGTSIAPFGLKADALSFASAPIVAIGGALCVLAAGGLAEEEAGARGATLALALVQLSWFGWTGAAFARDFVPLIGFFEAGWIGACGLVALSAARERAAAPAALRHLASGAAFGILLALGMALAFNATGSMDFQFAASAHGRTLAAGIALVCVALAGAAAAAPLNATFVHAVDRGGSLAGLLIGGVGVGAMLIVLMRAALGAHGAGPEVARAVSTLVAGLGAASMAIGSVQAMGAQDVRRLAAYASAAQAGAVMIALGVISANGAAAGLMHVAALGLATIGILGGAAIATRRNAGDAIDGLGWRAPMAGAAMAASALSLIGAPLTVGFATRWRLVEGTIQAGWWWAAGALIAASLAAVVYAGRIVERLYLRASAEEARAPSFALAPTHVAVTVATIWLGFNASDLWRAALGAGQLLLRAP
ncbi:MAG: hypothetical protein JNJ73_00390 [Hyphomonadaceae bacterium]|nr:hypothetical protein [Hyphomonadaceae bacterium]